MSYSPVTAADYGGSLPLVSVNLPDAGEDIKAEDIREPVAALLAETDDIRNNTGSGLAAKVDRSGDTMTGPLIVTPTALDTTAITGNGNGTGVGVAGFGGTNGRGGFFEAGGGNNEGLRSIAKGTAPGIRATGGATGVGGLFEGFGGDLTKVAIESQGGIYINDAPPAGASSGGAKRLWSPQIAKAWVTFTTGGAGPYAIAGNPWNVASVVQGVDGFHLVVNFVDNVNLGYAPIWSVENSIGNIAQTDGVKNVNNVGVQVYDSMMKTLVDLTLNAVTINLVVYARQ